LRIAMISAHSCPVGQLGTKDTGGMSVYIRELVRELGRLGHKVDVFTRVHDPRDPLMESLGRNARLIHLKVGGDEQIHKLVLYSYLPDFTDSLEEFRKAHNLHYDLVFSHYWLSGIVGEELHKLWQVPNFIMFHTLGAVKNSLGLGDEEPRLRIQTETGLARSCQRVIVATEREKANLVKIYRVPPENITVISCGVNFKTFRLLDRQLAREKTGLGDGKLVLFVGRIAQLKGIDRLLKAFAGIPQRPHTRLVIVGGDADSDPEVQQLSQLAHKLDISSSVAFVGTVKHELMPYFYNAADVCVVSSLYESFGLVALEALACGTPVVATDVGNLRNIIQSGTSGYIVHDHSIEGLSERIAEVLSWPDRKLYQSRKIRKSIAGLSWTNTAERLLEEFNRVV
jgi:D-inositol-3-phosphate glycosyltransferase